MRKRLTRHTLPLTTQQSGDSADDVAVNQLAMKMLSHLREPSYDGNTVPIYSDPLKAQRDARRQQDEVRCHVAPLGRASILHPADRVSCTV